MKKKNSMFNKHILIVNLTQQPTMDEQSTSYRE